MSTTKLNKLLRTSKGTSLCIGLALLGGISRPQTLIQFTREN
uniref:Uncharacterized protein n=1 Tax=Meloidogyne enterolobii TaxID=390850 RepID=A0A6V7UU23_MELEN|nr:unnamed protein product [Meloidogyne enterolobii]